MNTLTRNTKIVPIAIEESLFETIKTHAQLEGESLEEFILNRLHDSIEAWNDYCSAVSLLSSDEEKHFHVRVDAD